MIYELCKKIISQIVMRIIKCYNVREKYFVTRDEVVLSVYMNLLLICVMIDEIQIQSRIKYIVI